ncbi:urease accessory protein UreD [Arthrobacter sp. GCM10027362]|uniref:urease accessory protein UreD n=1 Tax=Arthrobacter sp. GCM10027362 TaxID=3273379 RepID=UPI00362AAE2F
MSALTAQPATEAMGELRLCIGRRGGRSVATHQYHRGALRVLRPHYLDESEQVCYVIVNPGGAYLGGDLYTIDFEVGRDARLLLTTQSATKIYKTPDTFAEQRMRITLGPDAALEYAPDQLIAYRQANYRQNAVIEMDETASLILSEVITPGWSPDGEPFRYEQLRLRNEIRRGGRLLAIDNLLIRPPISTGAADQAAGPAFMEGYSHLGSLLVVDPRVGPALVDEMHALLREFEQDTLTGISQLNGPGFVVRSLSHSTEKLNALIGCLTALLRERWFGQGPLNLRKY